ncbi:MAG: LPXTG cell wall anchor domain-containing protein [Actinobacteria bacterium]|nr:LPXTG cell wall anchor domain-containing protein [Actinomycetota bacterium]
MEAALALTATRSCDYSSTLSALVASIQSQAADYVGTDPARAANLAILAVAVGQNPNSFGGLNLMSILAAGTQADGQVGGYPSSYVQALAVIAYVRAGQPVPAAVLANLVAGQDPSGAFGYTYGGTFYPDYDTTGLAIEALHAAPGDATVIAKAVAWAQAEQTSAGYWPNPYSPVDSTGILGSGLVFVGASAGNALTWLNTQQLADGGFPASLNGTTSNISATADAMWLLTGSNLVTVSRVQCLATTTSPAVQLPAGTGAVTLANTGSDTDAAVGGVAVATLVVGAGLLLVRRRQRQA